MASSFLRTSNRRRRFRAAAIGVVVFALATMAAAAVARRASRSSATPMSLMLEVRIVGADAQPPAEEVNRAGGLTLALNAMSDAERSRMAEQLGRVADRLERAHNPLVDDLDDDGEGRSDLERLARERLPTITAASALAQGRWQSADKRMFVRATTACDPGARCLPLGANAAATDDRVAASARFLAWPLAYGIVLRPPPDRARTVVEALRTPDDGSRIALVLGNDDLHELRFSGTLADLADDAARIERWAPDDEPMKGLFRRLSARDALRDDVPWLTLPEGALLVVPRLGALATIAAFMHEVRVRVAAVAPRIEWLALPPGTSS
jgi:hypothetical protein